jgi:hypothetical protein
MAVATVTPAVSPAQLTVITSEEISRYAEITSQLSQLEALQKALRAELLDLHVAGAEQETGSLRNHIRKYQRCRSERCGPHMINHETSILQQMLRRIGTWERVGLGFQPLSLPKTGPGRCISDEEERRLIRARIYLTHQPVSASLGSWQANLKPSNRQSTTSPMLTTA